MTQRSVEIETPDGICPAALSLPDGKGPWPAVIMFPDAGGMRETMRQMGARLTGLGYVVLVPDVYYRNGPYQPFDMGTIFTRPDEWERMMALFKSVTAEAAVRDARTYIDYLASLPETTGDAVGTTGYCMGGWMSLTVAGRLGDLVAAAASIHGGNLAVVDDPDSPHLLAPTMAATVYVAGATDDETFPDEQRDRLEQALTDAGVKHTIETYPAAHGFAVPSSPRYDEAAAERHWQALETLFGSTLG